MALVKCAKCEGIVSDKAEFCPHCGLNIEDVLKQEPIINLSDFEIENGVLKKYLGNATKVRVPDCVKEISGEFSIYGTFEPEGSEIYPVFNEKVEEIELPEGIEKIGEFAFWGCRSLSTIYIPNSVQEICKSAFEHCSSLEHINLPKNLKYIGMYAFSDCTLLKSINIPNSVISIGYDAFCGCSELKEIFIPESIIDLLDYTEEYNDFIIDEHLSFEHNTVPFRDCCSMTKIWVSENNAIYSSRDGLLYNRDETQLLRCPEGRKNPIKLPESILEIHENAFINCDILEGILITNILSKTLPQFPKTKIDYDIDLDEFEIKDNIVIKYRGIRNQVIIPKNIFEIGKNAFNGCQYVTDIVVQEDVKKICESAFENCSNLKQIFLPTSIENIEARAFAKCIQLNFFSLPERIRELKPFIFADCENLSYISLPNKLQFIDKYAFMNCVKLEKILLPPTLNSIEDFAFYNCVLLNEIILPPEIRSISDTAFKCCNSAKFVCDEDTYAESYVMKNQLKAKIKCKYCNHMIEDIERPCPKCGKWRNTIIPDNGIDIDHISIGDYLNHKVFGTGQVIDIINSTFTVDFGKEQKIFSKSSAERFFENLYRLQSNVKITQNPPISTNTIIIDDCYTPNRYRGYYNESRDEWEIYEEEED